MVKVSFVVPAYKRRFLRETIQSILAQTYNNIELIIVDDCSPQGLKDVVEMFSDSRLSYYANEVNIGGTDLIAAWHKAISYAKGEWIVCAGDDDVYEPTFAEELVALADRYPTVDAVHCRLGLIDEEGMSRGVAASRPELETQLEMMISCVLDGKFQVVSDFMYRREVLRAKGGFVQMPRAIYSDWLTSIRMAANGVVFVDKPLVHWRVSSEHVSSCVSDCDEKIVAVVQARNWLKAFLRNVQRESSATDAVLARTAEKRLDAAMARGACCWLARMDIQSLLYSLMKMPLWLLARLPLRILWHYILKPVMRFSAFV